ncbi:translation initiation factor eIF 4e-like domain-containing protein [Chaetomium fimeti]|jgi:translation initiation factor 4E|uniref:Translation initiation factor eIF 4e-like domain-containing protein n=1 Tax=Chaetomium fimeti TaxID=1854472 RepID=A0AAE0HMM5_9PEZI|nr:translation initiation factor eIF 4e-like domain-containing protein [Chaetomium fimeti]
MDNLWSRRANSSKLSLSTGSGQESPSGRNPSFKRFGGDSTSHGKHSLNSVTTPGGSLASPIGAASSAFGLGSGAFASFGSAKTPKSPGNPFEAALGVAAKTPTAEKSAKDGVLGGRAISKPASLASLQEAGKVARPAGLSTHQLRSSWVFWFRPPISKANGFIEYEKTLHPIATVDSVEHFFKVYQHLKRPSTLPLVSDYHLFKKGIRPIWEDEENKNGGKWVVRLRKGVADRYWEDLLLAIIGDQFGEAGEEVCGVVLSVRNGEDILSIWARANGQRVLKVRETMRRILSFPPDTKLEWKSHDSSLQQRTAIEESRREKANHHHGDKRSSNKPHQQQQHSQQQADEHKNSTNS